MQAQTNHVLPFGGHFFVDHDWEELMRLPAKNLLGITPKNRHLPLIA